MITVHGINTDSVSLISKEILDLADEALAKLYDIESLVSNSGTYFKGNMQSALKTKFDELAVSFPIVRQNLASYAEELNRLTSSYKEKNEAINLEILKSAESTELNDI